MRASEATITSQGQVTIPAEVRRTLDLERGDEVTFLVAGDRVELVRTRFTLETVFSSVEQMPNQSIDFDREIEEAMEDHAGEVVRKLAAP